MNPLTTGSRIVFYILRKKTEKINKYFNQNNKVEFLLQYSERSIG